MTIEIGQRVQRNQPSDYTHGRRGTVIELDVEKSRARVEWDDSPRTWVAFKRLVPEGAIPNRPIYELPESMKQPSR